MRISSDSVGQVLKVCERVHCTRSAEPFSNHLYVVLKELLPCVHFSVIQLGVETLDFRAVVGEALPPDAAERFMPYRREHPALARLGQAGISRTGSLLASVDPSEYRRGGLYNEVLRPLGVEDQIWMGVGDHMERTAVIYSCDRRYSEGDAALVSMIHPHAQLAWEKWQAIRELETALDRNNANVLFHSASLSRRQIQVIEQVSDGKTNREIAAVLGISPRTVGKHLEQIYAALNVRTRAALAHAWAKEGGNIEP